MICNRCGQPNPDGMRFCTKCGAPIGGTQYGAGFEQNMNGQQPARKKSKAPIIILIIVLAVILTAAAIVIAVFRHLTKPKETISAAQFKTIMEDEDYVVEDLTDDYDDDGVVKLYAAFKDEIEVDFCRLEDEAAAEDMLDSFNAYVKSQESKIKASTSVSGSNFHTRSCIGTTNCYYFTQIGDTYVYGIAPKEDRDELKDIFDKLGY